MINEKGIAFRYLGAQKKRSVLLIFGVVLAIALISALFSILNAVQQYEVTMAIVKGGIWHVQANNCTQKQANELERRIDVSASGKILDVSGNTSLNKDTGVSLRGCDKGGAAQSNYILKAGKLPVKNNEIALEQWEIDKVKPETSIGGTITVNINNAEKTYVLSGILNDNSQDKGDGYYIAAIALNEAKQLNNTNKVSVLMQVKDGVNINQFVNNISSDQHIGKSAIAQHNALLAALGRSGNSAALSVYAVGAFLALLVIFSAIMMIYNSFNISVMQRVRQFGLLRAVGATPKQIRKMVRYEAVFVSLFGVIPGLILGVIVSTLLILFLRFTVPEYFPPEGPILCLSWISLAIGAVTGVLSTVLSSLVPAHKASKVSPIEAMAVTSGKAINKKSTRGIATKIIPVEIALSLRRLMTSKRSFVLTSLSLSFGILLMLSFNAVTGMLSAGIEHNFDLGDMYVATSGKNAGLSDKLIKSLSNINGVENVTAKRIAAANATFDYSLLGTEYKDGVKSKQWRPVSKSSSGKVIAPSKSTVIGLSDNDISSLQSKLIFGDVNSQQLNDENGVILTLNSKGCVNTNDLRPGDYIYVNSKKLKICGIIGTDYIMYMSGFNPFIGFYTTNKVLSKIEAAKPNLLTMTLKSGADSDAAFKQVQNITSKIKNVHVSNQCEAEAMSKKITLVANVFIYGFIAVIALIGILNIINTMSTNVLVRTREIGLLRAGGMTMGQVAAMVAGEAVFYGILALFIGLAAGIPIEHKFYDMTVKAIYSIPWTLPWNIIIISSTATLAAVMFSIISPLRYIKKIVITQAVTVD